VRVGHKEQALRGAVLKHNRQGHAVVSAAAMHKSLSLHRLQYNTLLRPTVPVGEIERLDANGLKYRLFPKDAAAILLPPPADCGHMP
jgi:hypothetical protein